MWKAEMERQDLLLRLPWRSAVVSNHDHQHHTGGLAIRRRRTRSQAGGAYKFSDASRAVPAATSLLSDEESKAGLLRSTASQNSELLAQSAAPRANRRFRIQAARERRSGTLTAASWPAAWAVKRIWWSHFTGSPGFNEPAWSNGKNFIDCSPLFHTGRADVRPPGASSRSSAVCMAMAGAADSRCRKPTESRIASSSVLPDAAGRSTDSSRQIPGDDGGICTLTPRASVLQQTSLFRQQATRNGRALPIALWQALADALSEADTGLADTMGVPPPPKKSM